MASARQDKVRQDKQGDALASGAGSGIHVGNITSLRGEERDGEASKQQMGNVKQSEARQGKARQAKQGSA